MRPAPLNIAIFAALAFLAANPIGARAAPANTLTELWRALSACISLPPDSADSEITVVFTLRRDGSLLGKPRISHSHLVGDAEAQKTFVADAIQGVARCLPVEITDALGGAIAGRPIAFRIGRWPKETKT